jgi:hypothetical protein
VLWNVFTKYRVISKDILAKPHESPLVSGVLCSDFQEDGFKKKAKDYSWLYYSEESNIATIIHELGHAYFDCSCKAFFGNHKENIASIEHSLKFFLSCTNSSSDYENAINFPVHRNVSETFAACTEYSFAKIFYSTFFKEFLEFHYARIEKNSLGRKNAQPLLQPKLFRVSSSL